MKHQTTDKELKELKTSNKDKGRFGTLMYRNVELATINDKIDVPAAYREDLISWYHGNTQHRGQEIICKTPSEAITIDQVGRMISGHT